MRSLGGWCTAPRQPIRARHRSPTPVGSQPPGYINGSRSVFCSLLLDSSTKTLRFIAFSAAATPPRDVHAPSRFGGHSQLAPKSKEAPIEPLFCDFFEFVSMCANFVTFCGFLHLLKIKFYYFIMFEVYFFEI